MDDSRSPIGRFKAFVDSIARKGMNGKGEAASYVPFDQIEAYWSSERIENILQLSSNIPTFTAMEISHSYLKVFSILVLIDQVDYQSEFLRRRVEDTNLPIDQKWPYKCSVSQFNDDVIPRFYETQWAFCPVVISMEMPTYEGELNPRAILPFLDKQEIRRNDIATWSIARIMNQREGSQKDEMIYVLLKEYPKSYYNLYQQESKLLAALDRRHTKAMVRYYGSYSQVETSTILLEYSTSHSLNELFNQEPPSRLYDVVAFWTSLAHVAEALSCIHRQNISEQGGPSKWSSMLYDMKPENVIWFREFSECLYCFKLSTDGYTNANQRVLSNLRSPRINDIHDAAEYAGWNTAIKSLDYTNDRGTVDQLCRAQDIWELCLLLSDAIVWCASGPDALLSYREERYKHNSTKSQGWCYMHHRETIIKIVHQAHRTVKSKIGSSDTITPKIIEIVERCMQLGSGNSYSSAKDIYREMLRVLADPPEDKQITNRIKSNEIEAESESSQLGTGFLKDIGCDDDISITYAQKKDRKKLLPSNYTVGWVCQHYVEMAAARELLDSVHDSPLLEVNDDNTYIFGNIKDHNIVVVGLPIMEYGMGNIAKAATDMFRSFPSIRVCFHVGTAIGLPPKTASLEIGDVIISQKIVQYDQTTILPNGRFSRLGVARWPLLELATTMSEMVHDSENRTSFGIDEILKAYQAMGGARIDQDYQGIVESSLVKLSMLKNQMGQGKCNLKIHYGQVASGNRTLNPSTDLARLLLELGSDISCFEMGAIELLKEFPGLVIRGISSICGSPNDETSKELAATAAAAFVKVYLSEVIKTDSGPPQAAIHHSLTKTEVKKGAPRPFIPRPPRNILLDLSNHLAGLYPSPLENKKSSGWATLNSTWLDDRNYDQHHGLFWISGKPGSGKSILMRYMLHDISNSIKNDSKLIAHFFYSMQDDDCGKTLNVMYLSLLEQLLEASPIRLQSVLDLVYDFGKRSDGSPEPDIALLRDLLSIVIAKNTDQSIFIIVDALDECEHDFQDIIDYFSFLGKRASENKAKLYICFSSRHRPYVSFPFGLCITLESETGHRRELQEYIKSYTTRFGDGLLVQEIQDELISKSSGVFLWANLVLDILNRDFQNSHLFAMRKKLQEMPTGLNDLYKYILRRDDGDIDALLVCLQWILYAKRPLKREEFYYAIKFSLNPVRLVERDTPHMSIESMNRYVLNSSRGLAKVIKSGDWSVVQLVHTSVREYLIEQNGLRQRWPFLGSDISSQGHERLKQCCYAYIALWISVYHPPDKDLSNGSMDEKSKTSTPENFPFLEYAIEYVLHHANEAAISIPQDDFLARLVLSDWMRLGLPSRDRIPHYKPDTDLLYILAKNNLARLIQRHISKVEIEEKHFQLALLAALIGGHEAAVRALLKVDELCIPSLQMPYEKLETTRRLYIEEGQTPLHWAVARAEKTLCELIINSRGADVNLKNAHGQTPLSLAIKLGYKEIVKLLLDSGAEVDLISGHNETPLSEAAKNGHAWIVHLLIEHGAEIEAKDKCGRTALFHAAIYGHDRVVKKLLSMNADFNDKDYTGRTPLSHAAENGRDLVAWQLVEYGAGLDSTGQATQTPVLFAADTGRQFIVRLLRDAYSNRSRSSKDHESRL